LRCRKSEVLLESLNFTSQGSDLIVLLLNNRVQPFNLLTQ